MDNLKVKRSNFKSELTFNEWVEKYRVSSQYVEPTPYYQGNPSCGVKPLNILSEPKTLWEFVQRMFSLS